MNKAILLAANIIKFCEGCKLEAYQCPAKVWTCGWGSTGKDIVKGTIWTQQQADDALNKSLLFFNSKVEQLLHNPIKPQQQAALISFAYNLGAGALAGSTLLEKVNINPNDKDIHEEFMKWINAGGKVVRGLLIRRQKESDLYFS